MKERDKSLDRLRGFAMVWVIFVHTLYWPGFIQSTYVNILKSFTLFEMPLFFFITGASNTYSRSTNHYIHFKSRRLLRILVPYEFYACICAILSIAAYTHFNAIDLQEWIKIGVSWLFPNDAKVYSYSYMTWALWFIPVYLCIILFVPFFISIRRTKWKYLFFITLFMFFIVAWRLSLSFIQKVTFYMIWTYLGLFYQDFKIAIQKSRMRIGLFSISVCCGLLIFLCWKLDFFFIDMQSNKFPPNPMFFIFSCMAMAFLGAIHPWLDRLLAAIENNRYLGPLFREYEIHSMTIFLYQTFAFMISVKCCNLLFPGNGVLSVLCKIVLCFCIAFLLCVGFARLFGRVENFGWNRKKNNK